MLATHVEDAMAPVVGESKAAWPDSRKALLD
jgi:hypothetical protein